VSEFIFVVLSILFGLLGIVLTAGAIDIGMTTFGLGLIGFAVLVTFWLIKDYYDQLERR